MYGYLVSLYTKVHHTHKSPKPPLNLTTSSDLNYNLTILNILSTPTLPFSTSNHHGPTFLSLPPFRAPNLQYPDQDQASDSSNSIHPPSQNLSSHFSKIPMANNINLLHSSL
jgi:hypothetical protein